MGCQVNHFAPISKYIQSIQILNGKVRELEIDNNELRVAKSALEQEVAQLQSQLKGTRAEVRRLQKPKRRSAPVEPEVPNDPS